MDLPEFPGIDSEPLGPGRLYQVTKRFTIAAFPLDAPLPHAPGGSIVYLWINGGTRAGRWDWVYGPDDLLAIIQAFRTATSPDYEAPDRTLPNGSQPMIRPTCEDLVQKAIDRGRPASPEDRGEVIPIRRIDWPILSEP